MTKTTHGQPKFQNNICFIQTYVWPLNRAEGGDFKTDPDVEQHSEDTAHDEEN
jgi:hypothetical protein